MLIFYSHIIFPAKFLFDVMSDIKCSFLDIEVSEHLIQDIRIYIQYWKRICSRLGGLDKKKIDIGIDRG